MASNKVFIQRLVKLCELKKIKHVVFSPGSRNAPLVITFDEHPSFDCITIPDERVAGFFAIGMAQQLQEPVIICCTSGSAALNYAPAIVEAYYQKIPLLVLTADRPVEWIDQGAGQTMRQKNVYSNYIKASYELIQEAVSPSDLLHNDRIICDAINLTRAGAKGPVHINIPLAEPLYNQVEMPNSFEDLQVAKLQTQHTSINGKQLAIIQNLWNTHTKKLIICGQALPDKTLDRALDKIAQDPSVAIISETCSNRFANPFNPCIDRLITTIEEHELETFKPEIVVSLGDAIISKKIKVLLRNYKPKEHWFVNQQENPQDTFGCLTKHIRTTSLEFLSQLPFSESTSTFNDIWHKRHQHTKARHQQFINECPWSDLLAFHSILQSLPSKTPVQISNSSAIRYIQLFDQREDLRYYCNRGVSGIDGCTSTAAGAAFASKELTTLITGDMAFYYDSNALWNHHLPSNLRIILINNGGGGIFKIIPGPKTTDQYKKYFATEQTQTAEFIAKAFQCEYFVADSAESLSRNLSLLYSKTFDRPPILEIMTEDVNNEDVLDRYFNSLKL